MIMTSSEAQVEQPPDEQSAPRLSALADAAAAQGAPEPGGGQGALSEDALMMEGMDEELRAALQMSMQACVKPPVSLLVWSSCMWSSRSWALACDEQACYSLHLIPAWQGRCCQGLGLLSLLGLTTMHC